MLKLCSHAVWELFGKIKYYFRENKKAYLTLLAAAAQFQGPSFTFYAMPPGFLQWCGHVTSKKYREYSSLPFKQVNSFYNYKF